MKSIGCVKYDFIKSKRVIIKTIEIDYFCNSLLCRGVRERQWRRMEEDLTKNSTYKEKINWNKAQEEKTRQQENMK